MQKIDHGFLSFLRRGKKEKEKKNNHKTNKSKPTLISESLLNMVPWVENRV